MGELRLNAKIVKTRAQLHDAMAKTFGFPDWYGRNLDALYDLLTSCSNTHFTLENAELIQLNLGRYGDLLLRLLQDAAKENSGFTLSLE